MKIKAASFISRKGVANLLVTSAIIGWSSLSTAAPVSVDWNKVLESIVNGVDEGLKSGKPQEKIEYKDDEQVARDISASMKAKLTRIRVDVPGFDTQEMVPGIIVFSKAVKDAGGKIIYCKLEEKEAVGEVILGFIIPYVLKQGKDFIAAEVAKAQIPQLAKRYHAFAYVRSDGRTAEYVQFRKRSYGTGCEKPPAEKAESKKKAQ